MNSLDENRNIVLKSPSGVITTPGYPSSYPQELMKQCFWKILAPVGNVVRVDFLSFRLPSSRTCLTIFFAINKRNPTQTLLCGLKASFLLYSMTNEIGIEGPQSYGFNLGRGGFNANYTTIPAGENEGWNVAQYVMCEGRNLMWLKTPPKRWLCRKTRAAATSRPCWSKGFHQMSTTKALHVR